MPIASGAAGRINVGVNPGTTWASAGLRTKTKPANRNCDSYLQRYQELQARKKNKSNLLQGIQNKTELGDNESEVAKEGIPQKDGSMEDHTSGEPLSGKRSKKSRLCVLL